MMGPPRLECSSPFYQYLVDCDEVIFMKEGGITERGSHEDLMNLNGDYAAIFNSLQLGETPHIEVFFFSSCATVLVLNFSKVICKLP